MSLNVPIFAGFATQARVRQAVYQRDAAERQSPEEIGARVAAEANDEGNR